MRIGLDFSAIYCRLVVMKRIRENTILKDLRKKMVFISGPRQVGKTWLAKEIAERYERSVYLNYDNFEDREIIKNHNWLPSTDLIIFDELHKMPEWKNYIKGVYDTKRANLSIIVTGSARLETFRQHGDSLAGRYFLHRLMPFSPEEIAFNGRDIDIDDLRKRSGFPEPFLSGDPVYTDRWRLQYRDSLIRQDILDFENIHDFRAMQNLIELLRFRVGSPISYSSLSEDLSISPNTVKKYISILESLYIIFLVRPYSKNISRSIKKEPKVYFFDTGFLKDDEGIRYENFVALTLFTHALTVEDTLGKRTSLHYIRKKDGPEVDFCIVSEDNPLVLIEAKVSATSISKHLYRFSEELTIPGIQLVLYPKKERLDAGIEVRDAVLFLKNISENMRAYES